MPSIKKIIETTERTVENLITKEGEFQFLNGGFVREGVPYHIHYTVDKKEYYMTGPEHHPLLSKLMTRRKNDSIFSQYINVFPAKREKYLDAHSFELTEGDLETGYTRRYFAKLKSNPMSTPIEIKEKTFNGKHKNYAKTSIKWRLSGTKDEIEKSNLAAFKLASEDIPNIATNLDPLEFWESDAPSHNSVVSERLEKLKVFKAPPIVEAPKPKPPADIPPLPSMPLVRLSKPKGFKVRNPRLPAKKKILAPTISAPAETRNTVSIRRKKLSTQTGRGRPKDRMEKSLSPFKSVNRGLKDKTSKSRIRSTPKRQPTSKGRSLRE